MAKANRKKPKGTKRARVAASQSKSARQAAKRAEKLRNFGPDASGNYGANPYESRHRIVDTAPKSLGSELPKHSAFPVRMTQRIIDQYRAHKHITEREFAAAEFLLRAWTDAGLEPRMCAGYDPDAISSGNASTDRLVAARIDGAATVVTLLGLIDKRLRGVVRAVVIDDISAAEWARELGYGERASKGHGMRRLCQGLQALAAKIGH